MKLFQSSLGPNPTVPNTTDYEELKDSNDLQDRCYLGYLTQNQEVLSAVIKDNNNNDGAYRAEDVAKDVQVKIVYKKDMVSLERRPAGPEV